MAGIPAVALFCLLIPVIAAGESVHKKPHIVYVMGDDLGWRDVGWNAPDMYTPKLNELRAKGVELTNHYMQPACSASRLAMLTGIYPWRLGLQRNDMAQFHRWRNHSMSLEHRILPEYLRSQGYANHLVGKWQMGFCNWEYTPTRRGFESFYGTYGGNSDHFNHIPDVGGYDFRDNLSVDWSANGNYSADLYTERAIEIIKEHKSWNDTRPLFLFLSYEVPHVPAQAPKKYLDRCSKATGERRDRCGMMAALDDGVSRVMCALNDAGYDDNLLLIFTSDNGAPAQQGGSNWPLRGKKRGAYEGGVKVPTFIYSKTLLPEQPYRYNGLMHVTDWLPTLLQVAGADEKALLPGNLDGLGQWPSIGKNEPGPRTEMVLDLDKIENYGAVRMGRWKLVKDNSSKCWGWYNPPPDVEPEDMMTRKVKCGLYQLFDLEKDPYEKTDLSDEEKEQLKRLRTFMEKHFEEVAPLPIVVNGTKSDPKYWGGAWSPGWCETSGADIDAGLPFLVYD